MPTPATRSARSSAARSSTSRRPSNRPPNTARHDRRELRRERRAVRRRLATPPPDYLEDPDVGPAGSSSSRRTRLKFAVAALPLLVAVVLLAVNALTGPVPSATAPSPTDQVAPEVQGVGWSGAPVERGSPDDVTAPAPSGAGAFDPAENRASIPGAGDTVPVEPVVPSAPEGHRPVAVRFASPDAVALVGAEDRVDVVGLDGSVLASGLRILQDRSSAQAPVLVLSVPEDQAPAVAAAAVTQDLTVVVAPRGS